MHQLLSVRLERITDKLPGVQGVEVGFSSQVLYHFNMFLCLQVPSSEVSLIPTPLPTPKPTPIASRTHSPVRSLTRSLTTIPAVHEGVTTIPGYGSPTPSSRKLATGTKSPAASPRQLATRSNQPGVALKEPTVTQPTAAVTVESTTAVSRQLEQAAAMVLANTSNMLTHAAAALVSSQAPATVHSSDQRAADLEKAVALVLSSAKQGQGAGTREEWDVGLTDTEEELEVDGEASEEDVLRELRLMETLGESQLYVVVSLYASMCVWVCVHEHCHVVFSVLFLRTQFVFHTVHVYFICVNSVKNQNIRMYHPWSYLSDGGLDDNNMPTASDVLACSTLYMRCKIGNKCTTNFK